jgi:undecaprenyl diphosphate synthase
VKQHKTKQLNHVSIIMDGNGRWAREKGLIRTEGHRAGVEKAREMVLLAKNMGIPYLSLYTFSKENWKRAKQEVSFLMNLIVHHFKTEFDFYIRNRIRIIHLGDRNGLPGNVLSAIDQVTDETKDFDSLTLLLAINYSGQFDILQAYNRLAAQGVTSITENDIKDNLLTAGYPDPDLIIRTSGEFRISNYFLWQAAYSEFYIVDSYWPDLSEAQFKEAIENYLHRDRRFGAAK